MFISESGYLQKICGSMLVDLHYRSTKLEFTGKDLQLSEKL